MTRITAFLIALTLTAGPAAGATCCHEGLAAVPQPMIEAGGNACGAVLNRDAASIMDNRAAAGAAVVPLVLVPVTTAIGTTAAPVRLLRAPGAWLRPPGVLRI